MGGWKVDLELLGVVLMGTACTLIHVRGYYSDIMCTYYVFSYNTSITIIIK